MTDEELAMAYADGELDAIAAKRFERRMAAAPELAAAVEAHRALRARLERGFAPIAEAPVPERLTGLLDAKVVALRPAPRISGFWRAATAMAACLVAGVAIGQFAQPAPGVSGDSLVASGALAQALDRELAGAEGPTRVSVSFRDAQGHYCRVFQAPAVDGIACRENGGWALRRTQAGAAGANGDYRQAAAANPELFAAAQDMMAGDPLDPAAERAARDRGWRDRP
ncbi:MAG: anti-sigma factor [Pseudomonadota bacterium]